MHDLSLLLEPSALQTLMHATRAAQSGSPRQVFVTVQQLASRQEAHLESAGGLVSEVHGVASMGFEASIAVLSVTLPSLGVDPSAVVDVSAFGPLSNVRSVEGGAGSD